VSAVQLGDDPTKEDVKTFTEKTLSSGKVRCQTSCSAPQLALEGAVPDALAAVLSWQISPHVHTLWSTCDTLPWHRP
jgi:hypothetical protein